MTESLVIITVITSFIVTLILFNIYLIVREKKIWNKGYSIYDGSKWTYCRKDVAGDLYVDISGNYFLMQYKGFHK